MDDEKANRLLAGAVAALVVVALAVISYFALKGRGDTPSALEPVVTRPVAAVATPTVPPDPEPVPTPTVAATRTAHPATATPAPAPKPKPKPAPLPYGMASVPAGSRQIIVITGATIGSNSGVLEVYNLDAGKWTRVMRTGANFGKAGLVDGTKRTSGHLQTPTGVWYIGGFVFGQHASAPKGTKMPYRAITRYSWWSSRPDSTYNTWVESRSAVDGEHLADARVQYEYAFDTGYNAPPNQRVIGRGAAIFIHCSEPPGGSLGRYTHGCVAIDRTKVIALFQMLDPARRPTCAIGTLRRGTPTSIYAY